MQQRPCIPATLTLRLPPLRPMNRLARFTIAAALCINATHAFAAISVTDDTGATVTLPAPAQRVISLAPHVTELLYAAGGGAKLIGAVSYSDYPPEAKKLPRVGDNKSLDLERLVALKPDLIVVWRHGNAQRQLDRLREMHIPLFFSEPHHLDDVAASLTKLGQLLGTSPAADAAAAAYRQDIAALRSRYAGRAPVSVFYQVWDQPLMTLNGEHMVSDVIALCGGRNVFAKLAPLVPTVSTEAVLAANPEAIVTAAPGATEPDTTLPQLGAWRAWPSLTAVANHNLFAIDGDLINRPAPRIAQGAKQMCEDLDIARSRRKSGAQ
ncbi:ABC-type Fe3+-hydroxamate transport system, periplasmic component [Paraburkholderia dioscoreae]|uniref:ABC-type Fe3+-hydroxamate transport system, periplasmic component n=2 Tax=Paraburkholderia dioscoreae TaxID=2604047 RepID=A0A5Q4YSN6_9BURK|nr:ABC-type Fe3+-hydroxamate transport system, periplasmic component [Paraburkholderia dioscoreae]